MLRKMLGWGGGDVNVPCTCTPVGCYARCWVGVGGMLTFLALAHMLDVQSSELLSKLDVQNTHLFSDGNRAWAKCAQEAGIEWSQVKHCLLQFARTFAKNGRKVTAGTQVIDKMCGHFDDFLPKSIHDKSKATRLINDQIWEYLYSWQWRQNAGKDLWTNMHEVFAD